MWAVDHGRYGCNFYREDHHGTIDNDGHGTHCAGIIGAVHGNGVGIAGITKNAVRLMSCKVDEDGNNILDEHTAPSIFYACDHGAKILNFSFGDRLEKYTYPIPLSLSLLKALEYARDKGVICVIAVGNDDKNNDAFKPFPASYRREQGYSQLGRVIVVAATAENGELASFSNFGVTTVDLAAPGETIWSTWPRDCEKNGPYKPKSGTSMAAPHVAGALALMWKESPYLTYKELLDQMRISGIDHMPTLRPWVNDGRRLNLASALTSMREINEDFNSLTCWATKRLEDARQISDQTNDEKAINDIHMRPIHEQPPLWDKAAKSSEAVEVAWNRLVEVYKKMRLLISNGEVEKLNQWNQEMKNAEQSKICQATYKFLYLARAASSKGERSRIRLSTDDQEVSLWKWVDAIQKSLIAEKASKKAEEACVKTVNALPDNLKAPWETHQLETAELASQWGQSLEALKAQKSAIIDTVLGNKIQNDLEFVKLKS
jgi:hypothetical protein